MSSSAASLDAEVSPKQRLAVLFEELAELTGQRNAIDGRIVDIITDIDRHHLAGITGARSIPALIAWKTGVCLRNAHTITAIAERAEQFPRCLDALRHGQLSLDQVGVIAEHAADGSDTHYAQLAAVATVSQLRTAIRLEPRPDQQPPEPKRAITTTSGPNDAWTTWKITLPKLDAAQFSAALQAHHEGLIADWKRDHTDTGEHTPPLPTTTDAFLHLITAGWDTETAHRPHGQHTTVVVHVDTQTRVSALHLGPLLTDAERQYLSCDATCEVWFRKNGRVIGTGRATRTVNRRLRRALEHRDRCCVIPGCGATRGLHAHHIIHWEHGGHTELSNLVLVCPHHHREHHHGQITITGPAHHLRITDADGTPLTNHSLAHPPTTNPPQVPAYPGPTGERADWWWYTPFQPPPTRN